jgi:hypothetical protein
MSDAPAGNARGSGYDRADGDWYVEPPWTVEDLLGVEKFDGAIWDPACGRGTVPTVAGYHGYRTVGTDLVERGWSTGSVDFLAATEARAPNIVCNPPFGVINRWIPHALRLAPGKVAIFARLALLEGAQRGAFFQRSPLSRVWVCSARVPCPPGADAPAIADWRRDTIKGAFVPYAWFVWSRGYAGEPLLGFLPRLSGASELVV